MVDIIIANHGHKDWNPLLLSQCDDRIFFSDGFVFKKLLHFNVALVVQSVTSLYYGNVMLLVKP